MTTEHQASRTLVKSPPELWAECSDAGSLARHIGEFGEIRITRVEPETSVSWEADHASGTVEIEPSGWGTRVTLTAQTKATQVISEPAAVGAPEEATGVTAVETELANPPAAQADSVEEENDATVEETHAEPDPAVAAETGPAGGRWKRLIARTKRWFGTEVTPPDPDEAMAEPPAAERPAAELEPGPLDELGPADEPALGPTDEPHPGPPNEPEPATDACQAPSPDPAAVLMAALDSLGQAHHRPFSRA